MNRIGSLCTGTGALDMAVERVLGGEMVWYSEFEKHPSALLAQRFPGIPNIGDLTKIDWASLPEINILTGGYPCQPFSVAGKQLGEKDPRHLWPTIREAIRILRPRLTLLENVAGHRRLGFDRVLGDCAEDGLDVRWVSVRASDIGAPHRRERLFFVVTDPSCSDVGGHTGGSSAEEAGSLAGDGPEDHRGIRVAGVQRETSTDTHYVATWDGQEPGYASRGGAEQSAQHSGEAATDASNDRCSRFWTPRLGWVGRPSHSDSIAWGEYEPAIRRWEHVLGRPAPAPTEPNKNGRPRLAAAFDEWMMGLPQGWITDIDIPYGAQIKLCGNGVVPQQAELALRLLLDIEHDG